MSDKSFWFLENKDLDDLFSQTKMNGGTHVNNVVNFKKGDYVYMPEDSSDKIFFIISGKIKIGSYRENDKEVAHTILQKGDVFGELAMIGETSRKDFAQAIEDSEIIPIKLEEVKKQMKNHSGLSILIMKMMGARVHEMEQRLESLVFKDSRTRIIEFIILSLEKSGQRMGYEWVLRNFITHQDIANITATSRQTVTMVLNELKNENIIHFDRKRLLIRDLDRLKAEIK
ncbi:MAG TPA: Crp/Fnr family transcriptional regulator [Saprospiraceae bacterium]|nr:Crp/Fnr family transcriptional regulator [Saprospiraceae bacterium]HMU02589.1 Crp/Fnr family transcriptional regulator [Saprospiraceae bacterium]